MSMWKRLSRAVSSNLERFRDDPLGTIKRDIASFNADVDTLREQLQLLEADHERLVLEEEALGNKIRAALKEGNREQGLDLANTMGQIRQDKQRVERNLESTRRVLSRAEGVQASLREEEQAKPAPAPDKDPVIVVKARETLDRLQRELGREPAPATQGTPAQATRPSAPQTPASEKTLGAGGTVSSPDPRPQATKTLGGASVAYEEPHQSAPESGKTLGSPSVKVEPKPEPVVKVEPKAKTAPKTPLADDLDLVDELERLAELRQAGALSEEEFKIAKQKLIEDQG
jgi:putative oligomerization/nucleic acid binding protein